MRVLPLRPCRRGDQIKVLAEINRVRVNGFAWATAERIARVAAELLEATIKAAL